MKKIRGFKLNLRPKELQRRAKKAKLDLASLSLADDASLSSWAGAASAAARPAVLFDSFPADETNENLTAMPGLAFTLCLATLGADWELFREKALAARPEQAPLFDLAAEAALEDAVRFVSSLVEEEAKAERCALSPIQLLNEPVVLEAVLRRLEGHKIGVALGDAGLRPACSRAFSLSWLAKAKVRAKS